MFGKWKYKADMVGELKFKLSRNRYIRNRKKLEYSGNNYISGPQD